MKARTSGCCSNVSIHTLLLFIFSSLLFASSVTYVTAMVEGHSVHRVATFHRERLVGKVFQATSPNGRFVDGAAAIDGKLLYRMEAVGKNLFAFFKSASTTATSSLPIDKTRQQKQQKYEEKNDHDNDIVVVHVHFGMAGNWAVYLHDKLDEEPIPEPSPTNRLRLTHPTLTADLSAMTVVAGDMQLYETKKAQLGQDPLREDADPDLLWYKVKESKKSIGALIMDQSYFCGPGNIYRAEILFKAGVHPDVPGQSLEKGQFDAIWYHTVELLQRGYQTGSILTVDPDEAKRLGQPRLRRYIYNTSHCPRCATRIQTWDIASRKCYACPTCQPKQILSSTNTKNNSHSDKTAPIVVPCEPFHSHCAPESLETRLTKTGPERLTVNELKELLHKLGVECKTKGLKKRDLIELWQQAQIKPMTPRSGEVKLLVSSEEAAAEKAAAQESLAVEHIAELAPAQARRARATTPRKRRSETKVPAVTPSPKRRSCRRIKTEE